MDRWFSQKANAGGNSFQECTRILAEFVSNDAPPAPAAEAILSSVRTSSKHEDAGFEVLMLLLDTVAEFSEPHDVIVKLLFAIRDIPPSPNPVYYYLASMHRENLDDLSGKRYLWKPEDKQAPITPGDRWVNYNAFSVKLAKSGFDDKYFIFGFFCLRETLERIRQSLELDFEKNLRPSSLKYSAINTEEVISYDLAAAARWVLTGGPDMYRLGNSMFEKGWERGLAVKTDLWDREPGLSRGRWLLWQGRFGHFADQSYIREEVRTLSKEASTAIGKFMTEYVVIE
ncbi:hypothetical protein GGP41_006449 [Bipolaris sorokiniana]|uniref:Uncharacterized protein n=1 Tax=Cochliobolus sativus TaxID=45130 RepID=A0A8H6DZF9_COCSA|nr:hypothetical protein GGP41_006449 [Bipolaris sorokiniana]